MWYAGRIRWYFYKLVEPVSVMFGTCACIQFHFWHFNHMFCVCWSAWNAIKVEEKGAWNNNVMKKNNAHYMHTRTKREQSEQKIKESVLRCMAARMHTIAFSIWCCALNFGRSKSVFVYNYLKPGALKVCHKWIRNETNQIHKLNAQQSARIRIKLRKMDHNKWLIIQFCSKNM